MVDLTKSLWAKLYHDREEDLLFHECNMEINNKRENSVIYIVSCSS